MVRLYFKYSLIFPLGKKPSKKNNIGETRRQSGARDQLENQFQKDTSPKQQKEPH